MVGDHVILDTNNSTVVMVRDDRPRPVVLARNHHLVATSDTSSVWVHNGGLGGLSGVATRLGLDGAVLDQIALPALARPLVGTRDGLLVGTAGTIIEVDGGGSHREIAHGLALASDGRRLAHLDCAADLSCSVMFGTIDDPDGVRVPLQPDDVPLGLFDKPSGRFSPDGRWLALPLYRAGRNAQVERSSVVIFDVRLGVEALRLEGSPCAYPQPTRWRFVDADGSAPGRPADVTAGCGPGEAARALQRR